MITVASAPEARFLSYLHRVLARLVFYEHSQHLFLSCQMKQIPLNKWVIFPSLPSHLRPPAASAAVQFVGSIS